MRYFFFSKRQASTQTILIVTLCFLLFPQNSFARTAAQSTTFRIIPRTEWSADEALGVLTPEEEKATLEQASKKTTKEGTAPLSEKDQRCLETQKNYPEDFRTTRTETHDENGHALKWPRRYSSDVKLIVIHHTGESNGSTLSNLTGPEQVRAIYFAHTIQNGWGDIGYHYLIDREGKIYEGRAGGKNVVGAHVYCANVNTVGVALIGNFQYTEPSDEQLTSLRKLLVNLSEEYDINLRERVIFQGKSMPTVVAHRDLGATICAGRRVQAMLPAIRRLASIGDFTTRITSGILEEQDPAGSNQGSRELTPVGTTTLRLRPRGTAQVQMKYQAPSAIKAGESIATITTSDRLIGTWQHRRGSKVRTRNDVRADVNMRAGEKVTITFTFLAPNNSGNYTVQIGDVTYTLEVMGR